MNKLYSQHLQDWTNSCVIEAIINFNVVSISGDAAYERLLYGLDQSARRNDGRLCDRYI
jgi:ketosteroid isomerase-like protein